MHSNTNRLNHDFQIAYFLAGSCHTPDGAYALLCDLGDGRKGAWAMCEAGALREQAKRVRAQRKMLGADEPERLEGDADLAEINAMAETLAKNIAAAKAELAFIEKCIEEIQPQRRYALLSDPLAHEAAQREEWRLEFIRRAENFLATGGIPSDEFNAMRLHPDFESEILPAIEQAKQLLQTPEGMKKLVSRTRLKLVTGTI